MSMQVSSVKGPENELWPQKYTGDAERAEEQ